MKAPKRAASQTTRRPAQRQDKIWLTLFSEKNGEAIAKFQLNDQDIFDLKDTAVSGKLTLEELLSRCLKLGTSRFPLSELGAAKAQSNALAELLSACIQEQNEIGHPPHSFTQEKCAGIIELVNCTQKRMRRAVDAMHDALKTKYTEAVV